MMSPEMFEKIQAEQKAEKLRKQQYRHDWKIAIFNTIAGGVAGFITSLVFWLIKKII